MIDGDTYALVMMRDLERQYAAPSFTHRMAIALGLAKASKLQAVPVRLSPSDAAQVRGRDRICF